MFLTIVLTMLFAKLKGYGLKPIIKAYDLYPIFVFELVNIFLQINIFAHNYSFVKFAGIIKTIYLFLYIIPIVKRKLYKPACIGAISILVGSLLNKIVIAANGGKMPIFPTFSKITGYYNESMFREFAGIHILGNASSHLFFLTDYIDVGYSILSPGDILIHFFAAIIIYYTIKNIWENTYAVR